MEDLIWVHLLLEAEEIKDTCNKWIHETQAQEINIIKLELLLWHQPHAASFSNLTHRNVIIRPTAAWDAL